MWHPHNAGYGANQKTCYLEALQRGADAVVMLHPDGQYEAAADSGHGRPILTDGADLVLGSRFASPGMALRNGMPRWKYVANRGLTTIENRIMGTNLTEAHTGYRAYSRKLLLTVPVPPQLARLRLRFRADHAGGLFRSADLRGSSHMPVLRGRLVGEIPGGHGLRPEDIVGGRAAAHAPLGRAALPEVQKPGYARLAG